MGFIAFMFAGKPMVELVEAGLATTKRERMVADGRQSGVVRVRITDAGRQVARKDVQVSPRVPSIENPCARRIALV
jgi:hypothetical protein